MAVNSYSQDQQALQTVATATQQAGQQVISVVHRGECAQDAPLSF